MSEPLYIFHDKTVKCFDEFAKIDDYSEFIARAYLKKQTPLTIGDIFVFKGDLISAGYKWGVDFYVTKVQS